MMTIDQILTKLDHYYKEDQLTEVEPFLLSCLEDAKKEQEYGNEVTACTKAIDSDEEQEC